MRYRINQPFVISETIEGETIVIHLNTGTYYSLQGTGAEVWESIAGAAGAAEIADDLTRRYGVPRETTGPAVDAIIADLLAEELIAPSDATARETPAPASGGGSLADFVPPALARYTDMQDLVLLDPVHEVGDAGWPATKPETAGA